MAPSTKSWFVNENVACEIEELRGRRAKIEEKSVIRNKWNTRENVTKKAGKITGKKT